MMGLLVFKERLRAFYGRHSMWIRPLLKFALSLTVFLLLNTNLGYMTRLTHPLAVAVLSLVCAFLSSGVLTYLAAAVMLLHLYGLSLELTVIVGILVLIVAILYGGLQPGNSWIMVITPVLFFLRVSYVVPLVLGLSLGLSSIIPMSVGIFIYYLIVYVNQNAGVLAGTDTVDIVQKYTQILNSLFTNSTMILMVVAFAAALLVVFLVRNLSLDYAWTIAIGAGTAVLLAVIFIGNSTAGMNLSIVSLALEMLFSVILAFVYQFFAFAVDYSRTEFLQFEDDDYYYYVKAVPKIAVSAPDVKVQRINRREDS